MIRTFITVVLVAAASLSGCQTAFEREERQARAAASSELSADGRSYGDGATKRGEPTRCISATTLLQSRVQSDRVIDFDVGSRVYRNVLPRACPRLGFERRIAYRIYGGNLCTPDLITVLDAAGGIPGPSCQLGEFQPIDRPPRSNLRP